MVATLSSGGKRNARIRFERRGAASDGMGNTVGDWAPLCGPFWAMLQPIKGREEILQQRLAGVQPFELVLLSNSATRGVTAQDRVVIVRAPGLQPDDTLDVVEVRNPDMRNIELAMLCRRGVADG